MTNSIRPVRIYGSLVPQGMRSSYESSLGKMRMPFLWYPLGIPYNGKLMGEGDGRAVEELCE